MVRFKALFLFSALALLLTAGCSSTLDSLVYRPTINQGNYFTKTELDKLHTGMTKDQVRFVMGTPMLKDIYGDDVWFYIFWQQIGHKKPVQRTVILTFDSKGLLSKIDKKPE